ncbi:L,D-transpeptidase [Methylococcus sp. EFPC2]|uniref:L,D-transpeptidase n=1 Tax=Methylococcus sp. EFPC2 TaxID=2812648 RepID=UPI001F074065|nr:L,D-transpeptidase [Methylococcus sp. EFPC2]
MGLFILCWVPGTQAESWEGYGRSFPSPRYELDEGARADYRFGVSKAFKPYQDPPLAEARSLPNPLLESRFDSYNLIVIVNKQTDPFWGRAQTLRVYQRGRGLRYYWLISTGARGLETPSGYYRPQGFSSRHWSRPYDAPMLWAVFFNSGISLHSSLDRDALRDMGRAAASHGCVRIEDHRAEELYHLIGHSGFGPVDQLDRHTGVSLMKRGQPRRVESYKTLIIVSPTARWTETSPSRQDTAPGTAVKATSIPAEKSGKSDQTGPVQTPSPAPKTGANRAGPRGAKPERPALEDLF